MSSMGKIAISTIIYVLGMLSANAVDLDTYIKIEKRLESEPTEKTETTAKMFAYYLLGVAEGSYAGSSMARYQNKDNKLFRDYCPPDSLIFDGDLVKKTVDSFIMFAEPLDKSMNVAVVFQAQLAKNYPCK